MIDFRRAFYIECDKIVRNSHPLELKVLELSPNVRNDLRAKIAYFFGRIPEEDKIALGEI